MTVMPDPISLPVAAAAEELLTRVGGRRIPFQEPDETRMSVPESVSDPVMKFVSAGLDPIVRVVPLRSSVSPEAMVVPVRAVAPVAVTVPPVRELVIMVGVENAPVDVATLPTLSVSEMRKP